MAVLNGTEGNDTLVGGTAADEVNGFGGNDFLQGGDGADTVVGGAGNDTISGNAGNDWVRGGTGNDQITGGGGQDSFAFADAGAANADVLADFAGGWDNIQLDVAGFSALGATGRFTSGDARFRLGTAAQDADDRVIYNQATGQLWYDADGNGAGAAQLVATLSNRSVVSATDIWVFNSGTTPPPPPPTGVINGTSGNDTLTGTSGNDTINGLAGNDSLSGLAGNDSLDGGAGIDTMAGGAHDDVYIVDTAADVIVELENGGIDEARSSVSYALGDWVNNLTLTGSGAIDGTGNALENRIAGNSAANVITGGGGADTLSGGAGADSFVFRETGSTNADAITDFASGVDKIRLDASVMTALGTGGNFAAGDARFWSGSAAHDADDRVIFNASTGQLWYDADGNGAGAAQLVATVTGTVVATDIAVDNGAAPPSGRTYDNTQEVVIAPLSGDAEIDALLGTNYVAWDRLTSSDQVLQYTFSITEGTQGGSVTAFSAADQAATRDALAQVSAITGIRFEEVTNGNAADWHFARGTSGSNSGWFGWTSNIQLDSQGRLTSYTADGYIYLALGIETSPGSYGYQVLLHEIGHALGLNHPHDPPIRLDPAVDDNHHTVMTYQSIYAPVSDYQPLDIEALQWLYGTDGLGGAGAYADGAQPQIGSPQTADNLVGGVGADYLDGSVGDDTLIGGDGNDLLIGFDTPGNDVLDGGAGDDRYYVGVGDTLIDSGGVDTVLSTTDWTLAPGLENLSFVLFYTLPFKGWGNDAGNVIAGNDYDNRLTGLGGNDTIYGRSGADVFDMAPGAGGSYGNDTIDGGHHADTLDFAAVAGSITVDLKAGTASGAGGTVAFSNIESVTGSRFADRITARDDYSHPGFANVFQGGGGNDTITGGSQVDTFVFAEAPGSANADTIVAFTSTPSPSTNNFGVDALRFDGSVFTRIGATDFTGGDARFYAAAEATSGRDSTDRVVYDTATGNLYYDADGSGSGAALLVATLQGAPALDGAQIDVVNGQPDTSGNLNLTGTSGNDSLVGGDGNDTISGLAGHDTLVGFGGDDSLLGGDGNDSLDGGAGLDTLNGGLGDDTYLGAEAIVDAGGVDTLILFGQGGTLAAGSGLENLTLRGEAAGPEASAGGNELGNVIRIELTSSNAVWVAGGAGNDTILGGNSTSERFQFYVGNGQPGDYGQDTVDGGGGYDWLFFSAAVTVDFRAGVATGGGSASSRVTFSNIEAVGGSETGDTLIAGDAGSRFLGQGGNDTFIGGAGNDDFSGDILFGAPSEPLGHDSMLGGGGNDQMGGDVGNDTLDGGSGNDSLWGGGDADIFRFTVAPGAANADRISDFASGSDRIQLDASVMSALGGSGAFAAGDARFWTGSAAHDADDRVVFDASSGNLYYDADGTGAAAAQLIATVSGTVAATDIVVDNGTTPPPPPPPADGTNGTAGNDTMTGTAGADTLNGLGGNDFMQGQGSADTLRGGAGNDTIGGNDGADWIEGGTGNDRLTGGSGQDAFVFREFGAANADALTDFSGNNWDSLRFDNAAFTALGADGRFGSGDARFRAGSAALDADDRIIHNTSTGQVYYDADGNGAGAAQLVATLQAGATLVANDIWVI